MSWSIAAPLAIDRVGSVRAGLGAAIGTIVVVS
jgi:hypothetical protein